MSYLTPEEQKQAGIGTPEKPFGYKGFGDPRSCCCDAKSCKECKRLVMIGRLAYCGFCPGNCALYEVLKGRRVYLLDGKKYPLKACFFCLHYAKRIACETCAECLGSYELKNFKLMPEFNTSAP